jgi:hypothetical protein
MNRSLASAATLLAFFVPTAGCGPNSGTGGAGAASAGSAGTGTATTTASGGTGGSSATGGATSSMSSGTSGGSGTGGGTMTSKWPDTTATISVLADQLPSGMTAAQQSFVATHFVGSQKLTLSSSAPLRALNPSFVVLHYHLAIWQSAVDFILDGNNWGNDLATVTTHESWFWHNQQAQRLTASDGKFLMSLNDSGFAAYWESSLEQQVAAGQYDGIFFDSASPALLQAWVGSQDPRLAGTGAKDTPIAEWGGQTYIQVWQTWIAKLNDDLATKGIPLIPNTGDFTTTWDNTDYSLTAGIFSEGYADLSTSDTDWKASTNELLSLAAKGKIMILQNYLGADGDVARRLYYLGNYLLVKGDRTYLDYFASTGPLCWYPEWGIDLGAPMSTGATVDALLKGGAYQRDFAKGTVVVNPSLTNPVTVSLGATMKQVVPSGGGPIDATGNPMPLGALMMMPVTSVMLPPKTAAVLLK